MAPHVGLTLPDGIRPICTPPYGRINPVDTTPLSVLVVDDDPDTADSLTDLITLYGFGARSALSGGDALQLAAADPPDVVFLDLWMPGMDGWELARQLTNVAKPPILVAITGCETEDDRRRSNLAGIDLHLVKPLEPAVLVGMLKRFARALTPGAAGDKTAGEVRSSRENH